MATETQSEELRQRISQTEKQAMIKQNQLIQAERELQRTREEKDIYCLKSVEFQEMTMKAENQLQECRDKEMAWELHVQHKLSILDSKNMPQYCGSCKGGKGKWKQLSKHATK